MPGNTIGEAFRVTTCGESHGPAIGYIDGCPPRRSLDEVLRGDESADTVGRVEVDGARARLPALREALDAWIRHERSDPRQ